MTYPLFVGQDCTNPRPPSPFARGQDQTIYPVLPTSPTYSLVSNSSETEMTTHNVQNSLISRHQAA